jgi:methionyl aminopeptidase
MLKSSIILFKAVKIARYFSISISPSQILRRTSPLVKGQVSEMLTVPESILCPEYAESGEPARGSNSVKIYSSAEIPALRKAARLARKMLEFANSLVRPGITTDEIDALTHNEIIRHGAYPTPLNYCGFPKSICSSVNEVVCHGIPDNTVLQDGDIISIDISLYIGGVHGDNCGTVTCGRADPELSRLISATKEAVDRAIKGCKPGS